MRGTLMSEQEPQQGATYLVLQGLPEDQGHLLVEVRQVLLDREGSLQILVGAPLTDLEGRPAVLATLAAAVAATVR